MRTDRDGADLLARLFAGSETVPLPVLGPGCAVATLTIALVDGSVSPLLALSVFYLLPVLVAASRGLRLGLLLAVFTSVAWCSVDLLEHGDVYGSAVVPVANALSRLLVLCIVVLLVTALRQERQREADMARLDQLTDLANARSFYAAVEAARRSQTRTGRPVTLAYLDLDDFKTVNDELGHAAGDDLLRRIGKVLAASVRGVDTVARLGGDEFAVLLPDTSRDAAVTVLDRLHEQLTQAVPSAAPATSGSLALVPRVAAVPVSIGAVTFAQPVASVDAMVQEADRVMYEVKRTGKNRVLLAP